MTIQTIQIATGTDDAEETISDGDVLTNSSDLGINREGASTKNMVGFRFQGLNAPQGSLINDAYITFFVDETDSSADLTVPIWAEDVDDARTFTTTNSDISNRTKTGHVVYWPITTDWDTLNAEHDTIDISPIVQEVVARPGWSAGNDIVIIIGEDPTTTNKRTAISYEGGFTVSRQPKLTVDWDVGTYDAWSDAGVSYSIGGGRTYGGVDYECNTAHTSAAYANLVSNGDFESGTTGWTSTFTSFAVNAGDDGDEAKLTANSASYMQLYQNGIALKNSTDYRFTCDAYSSNGTDAVVQTIKDSSPFNGRGLNSTLALTTTRQSFTVNFTSISDAATGTNRFRFSAPTGGSGVTFYLDNAILVESASLLPSDSPYWDVYVGATPLVIQDATHGHTADAPTLASNYALTIAESSHGHSVDNVALSTAYSLSVDATAHGHTAEQPSITPAYSLAIQSATHGHAADGASLATAYSLSVADSGHGHAADAPTLGVSLTIQSATHSHGVDAPTLASSYSLTVADSSHGHTAGNVSLSGNIVLAIQSATHGHAADGQTLSTAYALTVADSSHAHTVEQPTPTVSYALTVAESAHGHTAGGVSLSAGQYSLTIADATHGHTAEQPSLAVAGSLVIQSALHGHNADEPSITPSYALTIAESAHGHSTEAPTLATAYALTVADAQHGHSAENATLIAAGSLTIQSATHGHTADAPTLGTAYSLNVEGAAHSHTADNLAISAGNPTLTIQSTSHGHTADGLALSTAYSLTVESATHGHTADNLDIDELLSLVIDSATHGHTVDALLLTVALMIDNASHAHAADVVQFSSSIYVVDERVEMAFSKNRRVEMAFNVSERVEL